MAIRICTHKVDITYHLYTVLTGLCQVDNPPHIHIQSYR